MVFESHSIHEKGQGGSKGHGEIETSEEQATSFLEGNLLNLYWHLVLVLILVHVDHVVVTSQLLDLKVPLEVDDLAGSHELKGLSQQHYVHKKVGEALNDQEDDRNRHVVQQLLVMFC